MENLPTIRDAFLLYDHSVRCIDEGTPGGIHEELAIAISIAFGHHGFGDKFTKDKPFIVVPIESATNNKPALALEVLEVEAKKVAAKFGNRVIVEGFREKNSPHCCRL